MNINLQETCHPEQSKESLWKKTCHPERSEGSPEKGDHPDQGGYSDWGFFRRFFGAENAPHNDRSF